MAFLSARACRERMADSPSHTHAAPAPDPSSPIPCLLVPGNLSQSWRRDRLITSLLFSVQQDGGDHTTLAQGEKGAVSPRHRDRDDFPSIRPDCLTLSFSHIQQYRQLQSYVVVVKEETLGNCTSVGFDINDASVSRRVNRSCPSAGELKAAALPDLYPQTCDACAALMRTPQEPGSFAFDLIHRHQRNWGFLFRIHIATGLTSSTEKPASASINTVVLFTKETCVVLKARCFAIEANGAPRLVPIVRINSNSEFGLTWRTFHSNQIKFSAALSNI